MMGTSMIDNLSLGSLLYRSKGIVEHVGIYLGFDKVIHTVPETGIAVVSIKEFSADKNIKVIKTDELDVYQLSSRIQELFSGNTGYSLSERNCQHVAHYILTGNKKSPQMRWSVTAALIAAFFALYRRQNPLPYIVLGSLVGCISYSLSLEYDQVLLPHVNE